MDSNARAEALCALYAIRDIVPTIDGGICANMRGRMYSHDFMQAELWLKDAFQAWPEYSGNIIFPVPAPHKRSTPGWAYVSHTALWGSGQYGESRKRLLAFLIQRLEQEMSA